MVSMSSARNEDCYAAQGNSASKCLTVTLSQAKIHGGRHPASMLTKFPSILPTRRRRGIASAPPERTGGPKAQPPGEDDSQRFASVKRLIEPPRDLVAQGYELRGRMCCVRRFAQ